MSKCISLSLRMLLFMTILTGLIYPVVTTLISKAVFHDKAEGSLLLRDGKVIGSELIAQKFESSKYFWPRPSSIDYNPMPSGGSNLSQESADLLKQVQEREKKLKAAHAYQGETVVPQDLLFASGSGLDPHITPAAAEYQAQRVADGRAMNVEAVKALVKEFTERPQLGFLGDPRVNVVKLNLALDNMPRGN
jgi:potassium-transporting ATPase KdpC subunit